MTTKQVSNDGWTTITKKQHSQQSLDDIPIMKKRIVVTHKPTTVSASKVKMSAKAKETNNLVQKIDEGDYEVSTVKSKMAQKIIKARQEKGWTQKELATQCNLNVSVIKGYENCSVVPNINETNKISAVLGVGLSNK